MGLETFAAIAAYQAHQEANKQAGKARGNRSSAEKQTGDGSSGKAESRDSDPSSDTSSLREDHPEAGEDLRQVAIDSVVESIVEQKSKDGGGYDTD